MMKIKITTFVVCIFSWLNVMGSDILWEQGLDQEITIEIASKVKSNGGEFSGADFSGISWQGLSNDQAVRSLLATASALPYETVYDPSKQRSQEPNIFSLIAHAAEKEYIGLTQTSLAQMLCYGMKLEGAYCLADHELRFASSKITMELGLELTATEVEILEKLKAIK